MKQLLLTLAFLTLSGSAMAFPSASEMETNFNTCAQNSGWLNNWGRYIVSYDRSEAADVCRAAYSHGSARVIGCRQDGHYLYAGYYCQAQIYLVKDQQTDQERFTWSETKKVTQSALTP